MDMLLLDLCITGKQLHADNAADEFNAHFMREHVPKLLITTSQACCNVSDFAS
jgi:hypothetical protein